MVYVGSRDGVERRLAGEAGIPYRAVPAGKLRRYPSPRNVLDALRVPAGVLAGLRVLSGLGPRTLVLSTGGYVSLPVVAAARLLGRTVLVHEQTSRAGLANRLASRLAAMTYVSFPSSLPLFPAGGAVVSGYPLREAFLPGGAAAGAPAGPPHPLEPPPDGRPLLLAAGGGNGSALVNRKVREALPALAERFRVVHQVGRPFEAEHAPLASPSYKPAAFVGGDGMAVLLARSRVVLSRAGAGTVHELLALGKRSILVPLAIAQRDEQLHNAREARAALGSLVVEEDVFQATPLERLIDGFLADEARPRGARAPGVPPAPPAPPRDALGGTDFLVGEVERFLAETA